MLDLVNCNLLIVFNFINIIDDMYNIIDDMLMSSLSKTHLTY